MNVWGITTFNLKSAYCSKMVMEKIPKEYWERRIWFICIFIYYPILLITLIYASFLPFVKDHLRNYQKFGNVKSTLIIVVISISSHSAVIGMIWRKEIFADPSKYIYLLILYFCLIVYGYMSLQFIRDLRSWYAILTSAKWPDRW